MAPTWGDPGLLFPLQSSSAEMSEEQRQRDFTF